MNRLGAFDDEGAFSFSNPLVTEEFANARGLRTRQGVSQGGHAKRDTIYTLSTFAPGCCFGSSNPLCPCLGALEKRQLATSTIIFMLQLLELRLEVGLLLLVQGCTFLARELHPVAADLGPLDPLLQGFAQL